VFGEIVKIEINITVNKTKSYKKRWNCV